MVDGDMGAGGRGGHQKTEATMKRGRILTRALPLLIIIGLALSACAVQPGGYVYDGYPYYGYPHYPVYGSFDFDYGGWGHGFAHGGFGGHGGGGHR
jgi:hypothetical protein